jgi:hypothetical protein
VTAIVLSTNYSDNRLSPAELIDNFENKKNPISFTYLADNKSVAGLTTVAYHNFEAIS